MAAENKKNSFDFGQNLNKNGVIVDGGLIRSNFFALKMFLWPTRPLLSFIFGLFKQTSLQFLQQIYVKIVHPVNGAGIRTHDLQNMSLFP